MRHLLILTSNVYIIRLLKMSIVGIGKPGAVLLQIGDSSLAYQIGEFVKGFTSALSAYICLIYSRKLANLTADLHPPCMPFASSLIIPKAVSML